MINDVKLVIADIDGTLVNEQRELMPITRKVLYDLHKRGILLGIASGRPIGEHLYENAKEWGIDFDFDVWIGMNGGQLRDNVQHTEREFYKLKPDQIKEILELMKDVDANPFIYIGEDMLSRYVDEDMISSMKRHNIQCTTVKDESDFWKTDTNKMLFRLKDASEMEGLEKFLSEHRSDNFVFFKTQPTMMEFQDPHINKGIGLKNFCEENNISLDQVMSFGDTSNDNEMLKLAGWGVCLKQGSSDTKECAAAITEYTNDEDGMGRYLLDHLYKENGWTLD